MTISQTKIDGDNIGKASYLEDEKLVTATGCLVENLWENFLHGLDKSKGSGQYLGSRTSEGSKGYSWETYETVREKVLDLATGLFQHGCVAQDKIGIFSLNTAEWVMVDLACSAGNFVSIPMYSSFGEEALCHIISQTEMRILFASGTKTKDIMRLPFDRIPELDTIVVMDNDMPTESEMEMYKDAFQDVPTIVRMSEFVAKKQDLSKFHGQMARLDDIATICYTSGTTGMPKGVILTHGNIISELAALEYAAEHGKIFTPRMDDVHMSYLPLAHIFERVVVAFMTRAGGQIGFFRGVTGAEASKCLMEDIAQLRPTIFISVPRIYNRLYEKVIDTVNEKGGITKNLFEHAMNKKLKNMKNKHKTTHFIWDHLIFAKLRQTLGGRVRVLVTGSAPLAEKVMDFLRIAFNAEVYEGYGQTETSSGITITMRDDYESGHVGCPLANCEIKLIDIPEMNYYFTDKPSPRGEICVKGGQVFKGYYKDAEKTAEAFTEDGWYKTGDIGSWDKYGRLIIVDRRKSMFKLAQGEYISPEKVETILTTYCDLISQIYVTGDSLQNYPVAIVVPNMERVAQLAETNSGDFLLPNLFSQIRDVAKQHGLNGYEIPQKVYIEENGAFPEELMTPTFKLKRSEARNYYAFAVAKMYN